ncbi:hypothetical protein LCGC14_3079460, partial [marine sediment metagenome]
MKYLKIELSDNGDYVTTEFFGSLEEVIESIKTKLLTSFNGIDEGSASFRREVRDAKTCLDLCSVTGSWRWGDTNIKLMHVVVLDDNL